MLHVRTRVVSLLTALAFLAPLPVLAAAGKALEVLGFPQNDTSLT